MTVRQDALLAAISRLADVLKAPESDVTRDAAIQRFEFCFELAWKCIQERVRGDGLSCQSPRDCLKLAFKTSLIENEQGWLAMLEDRNKTSHTYDENLAKDVFRRLPNYLPLLNSLLSKLNS